MKKRNNGKTRLTYKKGLIFSLGLGLTTFITTNTSTVKADSIDNDQISNNSQDDANKTSLYENQVGSQSSNNGNAYHTSYVDNYANNISTAEIASKNEAQSAEVTQNQTQVEQATTTSVYNTSNYSAKITASTVNNRLFTDPTDAKTGLKNATNYYNQIVNVIGETTDAKKVTWNQIKTSDANKFWIKKSHVALTKATSYSIKKEDTAVNLIRKIKENSGSELYLADSLKKPVANSNSNIFNGSVVKVTEEYFNTKYNPNKLSLITFANGASVWIKTDALEELPEDADNVSFSKDRGIYDDGFTLTLSNKYGLPIKYTLDGSNPDNLKNKKALTYTGPITIDKTSVVRTSTFANNDKSFVNTYILTNNYSNEKAGFNYTWRYKKKLTAEEYAKALKSSPIISLTSDKSALSASKDALGTFEYISADDEEDNISSISENAKYGQVSSGQFNAGVKIKFPDKLKYKIFDKEEDYDYKSVKKFKSLKLKEGEDGPQADIWGLAYNRYDEQVENALERDMGKLAPRTKYVNYFYNGQYMGLKTLKEDFKPALFSEYFGGKKDDYTRVRFQDGSFSSGTFTDGDQNLWKTIKSAIDKKDYQSLKKYVDVDDLIKTQIIYMFTDTEREIDAIVKNDILTNPDSVKMRFTVNDTDGAFANDKKTGTAASAFAGGAGTYRYKWNSDSISLSGPGKMFANFANLVYKKINSTQTGNLEFRTLIKDQVLKQLGTLDNVDNSTTALSIKNVNKLISENIELLKPLYKLDASFMGAHSDMYDRWLKMQDGILNQTKDRVEYSLKMWANYGLSHTLDAVKINKEHKNIYTLDAPKSDATIYCTIDGSDPMGADGVISNSAIKYELGSTINTNKLTVREFTSNNWGPLTTNK